MKDNLIDFFASTLGTLALVDFLTTEVLANKSFTELGDDDVVTRLEDWRRLNYEISQKLNTAMDLYFKKLSEI